MAEIRRRIRGSFQPRVAHWFELYIPRNETVYAVEALAKSGQVQLEPDTRFVEPLDLEPVRQVLGELESFCDRYRIALPSYELSLSRLDSSPEEAARHALDYVHHWSRRYFQLEDELKREQAQRENLTLLARLLDEMDEKGGIEQFGRQSDFLFKGVYACPKDHPRLSELRGAFSQSLSGDGVEFIVVAALPEARPRIKELIDAADCLEVTVPEWLGEGLAGQRESVAHHLAKLDGRIRDRVADIDAFRRNPHLKQVLANVSVLNWFVENTPKLGTKQRFCHLTGWTTMREYRDIEKTLKGASIHAVARYPQPPIGALPPVHRLEHWWSRPFDMFSALAQRPGQGEIDPGLVIPLVVPLLFGFMFPDVGHGLVIALLGVVLSIHRPQLRFLVPCGLGAMLFGLLFGEVFGIEGLLPAIWFHPLEEPLRILAISLFFGAGLMLIGMLFSAVEAYWKGEFRKWLAVDAAVLVLYVSLLFSILFPGVIWLMPAVLAWYLAGSSKVHERHAPADVLIFIGHLIQSVYELAINSFSFIRVGAFALAHAGLTAAVITLSEGFDTWVGQWATLLLGHLFVIAIEGLVVFIQTLRLLLFEFFIRLLVKF